MPDGTGTGALRRRIAPREVTPRDPGPAPRLDFVDVAALVIDDRYQRPIERRGWANIAKIAANFEWARFSPILVAPLSDGRFAVVDGQHRAHAAATCGIARVPAMIVEMTPQKQASAFTWVNGAVTAMNPWAVYKAALAAGEGWAVAAEAAVSRGGCTLMACNKSGKNKMAGELYCVGLIRSRVAAGQAAGVTEALGAIRDADEDGDPFLYTSTVLEPWFDVVASTELSRADLTAFLRANDLVSIIDRVDVIRREEPYRSRPRKEVARDAIRTLLRAWLKSGGANA